MKTHLTVFLIMAAIIFAVIGIASAVVPVAYSADFTSGSQIGPAPLTVAFTATTENMTAPPITYQWDFGDGSGKELLGTTSVSHVYTHTGHYTVSLVVTSGIVPSQWVSVTKTDYIHVTNVAPTGVGFTYITSDPPFNAAPLTVTFTSTATGNNLSYAWDFGDGGSSADINPVHTYTLADSYLVTLTISNDGGSASHSDTVLVRPAKPSALFSASSSTTGPVPLAVQFQDESTGLPALTYLWHFGDGGISTSVNPLHAYGTIGLYTVSLTVTSESGSDTFTRNDYINVTNVTGPVICPMPEPTTIPTTEPTQIPTTILPDKIGVYKDGVWYTDRNGNGTWDVVIDGNYNFGGSGWTPITGDWNGDGKVDIGVTNGQTWYLDLDNNGIWTADRDVMYNFGAPGWTPVVGDWNGNGQTKIGVTNGQTWYLDMDGDGIWNAGIDRVYNFGAPGWTPVVGKF